MYVADAFVAFAYTLLVAGGSLKTSDPGNEVEENQNLHSKSFIYYESFLSPLSWKFTIKKILFLTISKVIILLLIIYF